MTDSEKEMWSFLLIMCLAALIHPQPHVRVRQLAGRYIDKTKFQRNKRLLRMIKTSVAPQLVVLKTYSEIDNETLHAY